MKIKVLGTGSSGNCYRVKTGKMQLLLECGLPYKKIQKALGFKISEIDACFVTHEHMDHAKACKNLMRAGIDCYMTEGTAKALGLEGYRLKTFVKSKDTEKYGTKYLNGLLVKPFDAVHDAKEPVSFYMKNRSTNESLMFITDTAYLKYRIPPVNYLMVECNYSKKTLDENLESERIDLNLRNRIVKNHLSLETLEKALELADLSKCKGIYILHLSNTNSNEFEIKSRIQEITGCEVWI